MIPECNGQGTAAFPGKAAVKKGAPTVGRMPPARPWREQLRQDPLRFYTIQAMETYAIRKTRADVGKKVKASKRVFVWEFSFGPRGEPHVVELRVSVMTGKRVISVDGAAVYTVKTGKPVFHHSFSMDGAHLARVASTGNVEDSFDLSVDSVPFGAMRVASDVSDEEAARLDAKAAATGKRMADDAASRPPRPPTAEDLAVLVDEFVCKAPQAGDQDARKFLEKNGWDPDAAVEAYRRMRDATFESVLAQQPELKRATAGNDAPDARPPSAPAPNPVPPPPPESAPDDLLDLLSFSPAEPVRHPLPAETGANGRPPPEPSPPPPPPPPQAAATDPATVGRLAAVGVEVQAPINPFEIFDQIAAQKYERQQQQQQQQQPPPPSVPPQQPAPTPPPPKPAPPAGDLWAVAPPPLRPQANAAPEPPPRPPPAAPPPPTTAVPPNPFDAFGS